MHTSKSIGPALFFILLALLFCVPGLLGGPPFILLVISLAIVGKGNRLLWLAAFPVLIGVIGAFVYAGFLMIPKDAELVKMLLGCTLMSVVPGAVLWAAVKLNRLRPAT
jgi:hypothetical protein